MLAAGPVCSSARRGGRCCTSALANQGYCYSVALASAFVGHSEARRKRGTQKMCACAWARGEIACGRERASGFGSSARCAKWTEAAAVVGHLPLPPPATRGPGPARGGTAKRAAPHGCSHPPAFARLPAERSKKPRVSCANALCLVSRSRCRQMVANLQAKIQAPTLQPLLFARTQTNRTNETRP